MISLQSKSHISSKKTLFRQGNKLKYHYFTNLMWLFITSRPYVLWIKFRASKNILSINKDKQLNFKY